MLCYLSTRQPSSDGDNYDDEVSLRGNRVNFRIGWLPFKVTERQNCIYDYCTCREINHIIHC